MFVLESPWLSPSTAFKFLATALTSFYAFTYTAFPL